MISYSLIMPLLISFILGLLIPFLARRFCKTLYMDIPQSVITLFSFSFKRRKGKQLFKKLKYRLYLSAFFWGLLITGLSGISFFLSPLPFFFNFIFIYSLALSSLIDYKCQILPDLITFPLLILGFMASFYFQHIPSAESCAGAVMGFILPLLTSMIMYKKYPEGIGGGDIKMLTAIGAWLGVMGLSATVLFSFIFFLLFSLIKKKKILPYGPALFPASLFSLYFMEEIKNLF